MSKGREMSADNRPEVSSVRMVAPLWYGGKARRLSRILDARTKRAVIVPLDDALLAGPEEGLRKEREKVLDMVRGGVNAILAFKGLFLSSMQDIHEIGGIINLTASTTMGVHTRKTLVGSVEEAVTLGLDAVAVHVNIGSKYETEMLKILGEISTKCDSWGMPLMALMYVRSERKGRDYNFDDVRRDDPNDYARMVRHAARVGVELGADIIKTQFTGSVETFHSVIESCGDVPVVIAGGPKVETRRMLRNAHDAVQAGAAGVCFGRNVFNRDKSSQYVKALRKIIHENSSVDEAIGLLE